MDYFAVFSRYRQILASINTEKGTEKGASCEIFVKIVAKDQLQSTTIKKEGRTIGQNAITVLRAEIVKGPFGPFTVIKRKMSATGVATLANIQSNLMFTMSTAT